MSADVSECLCEYVSVSAYVSACAIVLNVHLHKTHVTRTEVFWALPQVGAVYAVTTPTPCVANIPRIVQQKWLHKLT